MKKRNQLLNVFEALAAYLVVLIHYPFPGVAGEIFTAVARFSVPFFYAVSGYFLYCADRERELGRIPGKILRLLKLVVFGEVIYFLFQFVLEAENIGFCLRAAQNAFVNVVFGQYMDQLPAMLLVLEPPFNVVSWFMTSQAAAYGLFYLVLKFSQEKRAFVLAPVLLISGLIFRRVACAAGWELWYSYERFLLFLPVPFFVIGYYLSTVRTRLDKIGDCVWIAAILFGLLLTVLEQFNNSTHTLYFGTCFTVIGAIALASKHDGDVLSSLPGRLLNHVGERYTTVIYLMHNMIGWVVSVVAPRLLSQWIPEKVLAWMIPVMIGAASTVLAAVWSLLNGYLRKRK